MFIEIINPHHQFREFATNHSIIVLGKSLWRCSIWEASQWHSLLQDWKFLFFIELGKCTVMKMIFSKKLSDQIVLNICMFTRILKNWLWFCQDINLQSFRKNRETNICFDRWITSKSRGYQFFNGADPWSRRWRNRLGLSFTGDFNKGFHYLRA